MCSTLLYLLLQRIQFVGGAEGKAVEAEMFEADTKNISRAKKSKGGIKPRLTKKLDSDIQTRN